MGGAVGSEHVGGQGSGEGGGPEDQALCFVCVLPGVRIARLCGDMRGLVLLNVDLVHRGEHVFVLSLG